MKIKEISDYLEKLAPISSQESYDNCGLIVGEFDKEVTSCLLSLDCIEKTVDEAIDLGCNLIIAHHPIVFKGIKKLNGRDYVERTIIKAIKNNIAIYAIHTNFDNYRYGVNYEMAQRLKLNNLKILSPKEGVLVRLVCYVPVDAVNQVSNAMFEAGAGDIGNYSECSFKTLGEGTFKPNEGALPFDGKIGKRSSVEEFKFECLLESDNLKDVLKAMYLSHPYEEVAHEIYPLLNKNQDQGAGMIGELSEEISESQFLSILKSTFKCAVVRHTNLLGKAIKKVAVCGGSGSFLVQRAIASEADIFITSDFKYHEFFDADNKILIADIGHFESEQYTSNRLADVLTKKFPKFALHLTKVNTNPINYF